MSTQTMTRVPVDAIRIIEGFNARTISDDDPRTLSLVESVKASGVLVPLMVTDEGDGEYALVAGHRRLAAARLAGHAEVPVVVREADGSALDAAIENIAREQLTVAEEAAAVATALEAGLSVKGVAAALGWSQKRVTERRKVLSLPESIRPHVGRSLRVECVDLLLGLHARVPALVEALAEALDPDTKVPAGTRDVQTFIDNYVRRHWAKLGVFPGASVQPRDVKALELPVELTDRWAALGGKQEWDQYRVQFSDEQIDRAKAMDAFVEMPDLYSAGFIIGLDLVREFIAEVIATEEADRKAAKAATKTASKSDGKRSPEKVLELKEARDRRELMATVAQHNENVARSMVDALASMELTKDAALFLSRAALGSWYQGSTMEAKSRTRELAAAVALAVPDLRVVEKQTDKKGDSKPAKVTYAEDVDAAKWLRSFVEGGKTPQEIIGRTITVFAIAQTVDVESVGVGEARKRTPYLGLTDEATKALGRITKPHLPGSLKALTRERSKRRKARMDAYHEATKAPAGKDAES